MQAYGSDRVRPGDSEQIILMSRIHKGWTPRSARSLTSAEFPGTAVLWEEQYYEVVDAEALPQGGVRYVLEPWQEMHVMRTTDRYDAGREEERLTEYRSRIARETKRKSANALAILTGHLPAQVQEEMGRELGVSPVRLTLFSALGVYAVVIGLGLWIVSGIMAQTPRPLPVSILAGYLFSETTLRFFVAWMIGRPMGSVAGVCGYLLYYSVLADRSRAVSPFAREKGTHVPIGATPEDLVKSDALILREPLITLLSAADQARVRARFGYDYRHQSSVIAAFILFFALLGVGSSLHRGALISLLAASGIAIEQLYRLVVLRTRPAGSILGIAARPFVRKLL